MYDVGKLRKAALAIFDVKPGPGSTLVLLTAAQKAMAGLKERRDDLSTLIGYEGARQWDKDYARYDRWLEESVVVVKKILEPGAPTPMWAEKYGVVLVELFTGGSRAGAIQWAVLANSMTALEGAQKDLSKQTSWLFIWWVAPAAEAAAMIATAYDMPELEVNYGEWKEKVKKKVKQFVPPAAGIGGILLAGAAIWFGWPILAPLIFSGRSRD